jgi:hypothetical protein
MNSSEITNGGSLISCATILMEGGRGDWASLVSIATTGCGLDGSCLIPSTSKQISLPLSVQHLYGVVTAFKNSSAFYFVFTYIIENVCKIFEIWLWSKVAVHGIQF